jgi:hypothetical protein
MTDKQCEELGKRIQILAEQLNSIAWPNSMFDTLQNIHKKLEDIAFGLLGE